MRLSQIIRKGFISFDLETRDNPPEDPDYNRDKHVHTVKEQAIREISGLFDERGIVSNPNKLFLDLWNREKKASTAVGGGIAIPHVRSLQARDLVMGFARSSRGISFKAPDEKPVHIFLSIVGPRHEEAAYLRIYKSIAELFQYPAVFDTLMNATEEWEVIRVLDGHVH